MPNVVLGEKQVHEVGDDGFRKKNLCIMLNKCDLKHRPTKELLVKALEMDKMGKLVNKYYVKETSAYSKEGIDECFEWVIKNYTQNTDDN